QSARNFANKIWNAARFVLTANPPHLNAAHGGDLASRWIESRLNATISEVTRALDAYEFESATSTLYSFIWNDFCDWFLEVSKPQLRAGDQNHAAFMAHILETSMRLLHPFMPFISEEIWAKLPHEGESLALANWPQPENAVGGQSIFAAGSEASQFLQEAVSFGFGLDDVEADFALIQDAIRTARNLRAQAHIPPGKKLNVTFVALNEYAASVLRNGTAYLTQLANLEVAHIVSADAMRPQNAVSTQLAEIEVILPLEGLVDVEAERAKLEKQLETARKEHAKVVAKLGNESFTAKAPPAVVAENRARLEDFASQIEKLSERLTAL
ncbi:MAG: class I tRNA ligase family protein, partial [Armatimonadetes bacterium]|nr:class I tRNA ligase family protein [Armatimonadota bacterium]